MNPEGVKDDATSSLASKYQILFTLPTLNKSIFYSMLTTIPIFIIMHSVLRTLIPEIIFYTILSAFILFITIIIDYILLKENPMADLRRLTAASIFPNGACLVVTLLGVPLFLFSPIVQDFISLIIIGMLFSASIRFLIFRSLFLNTSMKAIPISFLQPVILCLSGFNNQIFLDVIFTKPVPFIFGILFFSSVGMYLASIDRSNMRMIDTSPLTLLRAFIQAWAVEQPRNLEKILDGLSTSKNVKTNLMQFETGKRNHVLIVPGVHSGPIYPVGSSNLPYQIYENFATRGYSSAVMHGLSGHELNLPSKSQVEKYISSFILKYNQNRINTCSLPLKNTSGNATATGMIFGSTAFITLTLSPNGSDDISSSVGDTISSITKNLELESILVDAHNSLGNTPGNQISEDMIYASEKLLSSLKNAKQFPFRLGVAHSGESNYLLKNDIGPSGISTLVFEVDERKYVLIVADANNLIMGLREIIIDKLEGVDINFIEITTSDTHVTAGKVDNSKGYLAMGDETSLDVLVDAFKEMINIAIKRLSPAGVRIDNVHTEVNTVGVKILNQLSKAMKDVLLLTKKGGLALVSSAIFILIFRILGWIGIIPSV